MEKTNNFHQFKNYSNSVSHVVGWGSQYSKNNISLFGIKNMSKSKYVKEKNIIKIKSTIMEHIVDIFQILWG